MQRPILPLFVILSGSIFTARADVTLSPLMSSHMVLQRDTECPIWGWADAGEEVTVEFAGQKATAKPAADGKWTVKLKPMKASKESRTMTVRGKNEVKLED